MTNPSRNTFNCNVCSFVVALVTICQNLDIAFCHVIDHTIMIHNTTSGFIWLATYEKEIEL